MTKKETTVFNVKTSIRCMVMEFCEKQGFNYGEAWCTADNPINFWYFGDYFFTLEEIMIDLEKEQPKGFIMKYYSDTMSKKDKYEFINYNSYIMGFRHENQNSN